VEQTETAFHLPNQELYYTKELQNKRTRRTKEVLVMETVISAPAEVEVPCLTKDAQFDLVIQRLVQAGYSLDEAERIRIRRELSRGTYGDIK
jgi:hypothetical protein